MVFGLGRQKVYTTQPKNQSIRQALGAASIWLNEVEDVLDGPDVTGCQQEVVDRGHNNQSINQSINHRTCLGATFTWLDGVKHVIDKPDVPRCQQEGVERGHNNQSIALSRLYLAGWSGRRP